MRQSKTAFYGFIDWLGLTYEVLQAKNLPFELGRAVDGGPLFILEDGKTIDPQSLFKQFLTTILDALEKAFGERFRRVVFTISPDIKDVQQQQPLAGANDLWLEVLGIIPKPVAAAMAYGLDREPYIQKVAVYDLGGQRFTITLLEVGLGNCKIIGSRTENHLGGHELNVQYIDKVKQSTDQKNTSQESLNLLDLTEGLYRKGRKC